MTNIMQATNGWIEHNVLKYVLPIYLPGENGKVYQAGTGFALLHNDRPLIITARHTLHGTTFKENSGDRHLFLNKLLSLKELGVTDVFFPNTGCPKNLIDVAAFYLDGFPLDRCLDLSCISHGSTPPRMVSILGYLARDFNINANKEQLLPKPFMYSNKVVSNTAGIVVFEYPRKGNISSSTNEPILFTPIPSGLSGCPILDTDQAAKGVINIVGVFTDKDEIKPIGSGVNSLVLQSFIASIK